jgi:sugar phosphate isomerase/epimerase
MMNIGLNTYAFKWSLSVNEHNGAFEKYDIHDILDVAARYGVQVLQICDNYPLNQLSDVELSTILKDATDKGISLEVGTKGVNPAILKEYLIIAKKLNAKILRTMVYADKEHIPDFLHITNDLASVAGIFDDNDICIAIENYEVMPSNILADIIENVGSDAVGVCFDTGNSLGLMERPQETINTLARYIKSVHLKDFVIKRVINRNGFVVEGCPLGHGMLNMDMIFDTLDQYKLSPNVIIEHWTPYTMSIYDTIAIENEWIKSSLFYLKKYLSKRLNSKYPK